MQKRPSLPRQCQAKGNEAEQSGVGTWRRSTKDGVLRFSISAAKQMSPLLNFALCFPANLGAWLYTVKGEIYPQECILRRIS